MKQPVIGITALCLLLCAGCYKGEAVKMIDVPSALTAPVQEPDTSAVKTNGDMLELLLDYQLSLRLCNGKLNAIRTGYGTGGGQ